MEIVGKLIHVFPVKSGISGTGKEWKMQEAVLETQEQKRMIFSLFGEDRIRQYGLYEGMDCKVVFDIDAHEYKERWYNTIKAISVTNLSLFDKQNAPEQVKPQTPPPSIFPQAAVPLNQQPDNHVEQNDLPF